MIHNPFKFSKINFSFATYRFSNVLLCLYKPNYRKCDAFWSCENPVFENTGKCALHCLNESIEDEKKYLSEFSRLFMMYLLKKIRKLKVSKDDSSILQVVCLKDLNASKFYERDDIKEILSYKEISIDSILFPEMNFNFLIKEFKFVEFNNCIFQKKLSIFNNCMFYKLCVFNSSVEINADMEYLYKKDEKDVDYNNVGNEYPLRENVFRYQKCTFKGLVNVIGRKEGYREISYIYYNVFKNCNFEKSIEISNVRFREELIYISDIFEYIELYINKKDFRSELDFYKKMYSFKSIYIEKCKFDDNFKVNGIDIDYVEEKIIKNTNKYSEILLDEIDKIFNINILKIEETKFDKKFELKNCLIDDFNFQDSNVKGIFDVYKSSFVKAKLYKSIFEEFAAFEYVNFGDRCIKNRTDFIYVTFKDFSNFRDTNFKSGLNFSRTNLKQEPNFLNTDINLEGTDRETLRIVKNSFEKNNNKIEAGKYHANEMKAYIRELSFCKNFWQLSILHINNLISRFGQSYIIPFALLLGFISLYSYLLDSYQEVLQFRTHEMQYGLEAITEWLNTSARNFLPFAKFISDKKGFEFVSLFFYIVFAILVWQIIVAVKKQTQH